MGRAGEVKVANDEAVTFSAARRSKAISGFVPGAELSGNVTLPR